MWDDKYLAMLLAVFLLALWAMVMAMLVEMLREESSWTMRVVILSGMVAVTALLAVPIIVFN